MVFCSLVVFGLVSSTCAYAPATVSDAWTNHADAFGTNNVTKIMLDYDTNSVLEVYDAGSDMLTTYGTPETIKGFFEKAFTALGSPNPFTLLKDPVVEEPTGAMQFGQVFLLWKSPGQGFPAVTDTFVFDKTSFKIIRQNVVVFSNMTCPQKKSAAKSPVKTSGQVQDGWDNHFAAFGGQNVTKIMLDYTADSKAMFFDVIGQGDIGVKDGLAPISAMFTGLFDELTDKTDLQVPYVATSTFGFDGDASKAELGMTFLIWRSPTDKYAYATDTFVYNSVGKIIRQNIVAVKTTDKCAAISTGNNTTTESDICFRSGVSSVMLLFMAAMLVGER